MLRVQIQHTTLSSWLCALALCLGAFLSQPSFAQSPFNGVSIEEVAIPPAVLANIDTELDAMGGGASSARTWRIYICMDDPDWEMQSFYGNDTDPWILNVGTAIYQNSFGGALAANVNPVFFGLVPELEFDSWFTIGIDNIASLTTGLAGTIDPFVPFEAGDGFLVNDNLGSSVFGTWLPPNSEGRPNADNRVLIAQFTTDGTYSGFFNFQFRRLNSDGTVYLPVEAVVVTGVLVSGLVPGGVSDVCPIVFLPVELLSFEATPVQDQVALNWITASELNNDYFTVERSVDQENWEEIIRMDGHGTSELTHHYVNIDPRPHLGMNYYRLKQTDYNGEYTYSPVRAVEFKGEELGIYPNPTNDIFYVEGDLNNVQVINIIDGRGRLVTSDSKDDLSREWNLSEHGLESGIYFVEFMLNNGAVVTEKLILK